LFDGKAPPFFLKNPPTPSDFPPPVFPPDPANQNCFLKCLPSANDGTGGAATSHQSPPLAALCCLQIPSTVFFRANDVDYFAFLLGCNCSSQLPGPASFTPFPFPWPTTSTATPPPPPPPPVGRFFPSETLPATKMKTPPQTSFLVVSRTKEFQRRRN